MTTTETTAGGVPGSRWIAARAHNIAHRGAVLLGVGGVTFAIAFAALFWFTRGERSALQTLLPPVDTTDVARAASSLRRQQFRADSMLAELPVPRRILPRAVVATTPSGIPADSLGDSTVTGVATAPAESEPSAAGIVSPSAELPDSVRSAVDGLSARLQRAQNAPLAASWRALAADPLLQQDPRVRALEDSLAEAERTRNEYDAVGGVDPIYLELSSRVTGYGRAIERIAVARRAALLRTASGATTTVRAGPSLYELSRRFAADSERYAVALDRRTTAQRLADSAERVLARARTESVEREASRARVQRRVEALAPPTAMLTASAVAAIGVALLVALLLEVRAPRLADDREAGAQSGLRVLLSLRNVDATTADALSSAFNQLVFDIESDLDVSRVLAVVSDDRRLALRTAARIAERLAKNGRTVRVMATVRDAARSAAVPRRAGVAAPEVQVALARPDHVDGVTWSRDDTTAPTAGITTVRAGTLADVRAALHAPDAASDVLLAVRIGATTASWLVKTRADVERAPGARVLGLVTWAPDIEETDSSAFAVEQATGPALATTGSR